MKKKQVLSTVLATAMIASLGVTASAATDVAANELAYKGELEIMHYSTSEESPPKSPKETADLMDSVPYSLHGMRHIRISR